ncbi:hypothetical protein PY093_19950 [Cytobacillus sp. S13-E01]|uniref:hypothetical protein n=1 Tax=Cytobacillus sp. S13-E01 TaxID=3031326 RepID=UPI0023D8AA8A|nr:hypothetical protein [Cytobacillus sp. S13-E01]MDF0728889.1 hypothetical protein [Cytobacillus sp. S13-E01]
MRLHIYSLQKATYNNFLSFIDQSLPFETYWLPLNEDIVGEEIAHFSIFLLDIQNANSIWLKKQIERLKFMGAHDNNFYFVLHNKEAAPRQSDIELVVKDLRESLSEILVDPKIHKISLRAYEAFVQGDSRFLYFDDILNEHRTIKQLETGDTNDYLCFQRFIGKKQVEKVLKEWSESPFLLFWKNSNLKSLLVFNVPDIVLNSLSELYKFNLIIANNEVEFLKIKQDKDIISITSVNYYEGAELPPNHFLLSKSYGNSTGNKLYFDEELYALAKLPIDKIKEMDIVFLDVKGYPKPKNKIKDWNLEIANLSGLDTVIKRVGVCIND